MKNGTSRRRRFLKGGLIGCGTVVLVVGALIAWVGVSLFWGPGVMEMTDGHPFRSAQAKEEYLAFYDARARNWPVECEERMVETSFGQTRVRVSGPEGGVPLVLLPGGGATSLLWASSVQALSEHYRTYAVDNIYDFGRSVYTRPVATTADLVDWIDELLDALDLGDNVQLMGLSYGGWLAIQCALRFPERLDGMVLVAPAATVFPLTGEFMVRSALCLIPHRYFTKSTMYWIWEDLARSGEAGRASVEDRVDHLMLAFRCFKFKVPASPTVLTDAELASIQVPTLFLVGEHEKIYSAEAAVERLHEVAPQIETEVIPGAGHDLTLLQADLVNRRMIEFLMWQTGGHKG